MVSAGRRPDGCPTASKELPKFGFVMPPPTSVTNILKFKKEMMQVGRDEMTDFFSRASSAAYLCRKTFANVVISRHGRD
jgi:hypothetical protein